MSAVSAAEGLAFSRTEIEALSLKAARGAGLSWGIAEEAGKITRRLDQLGLPGPEWLLAALGAGAATTILTTDGTWQSPLPSLPLCPLRAAVRLSDAPKAGLRLADLQSPGLILGGLLTCRSCPPLLVRWNEGAALIRDGALSLVGGLPGLRGDLILSQPDAAEVARFSAPLSIAPRKPRPAAFWAEMDRFAMATTVPATETSRAGAGATGNDND